MIFLDIDGVIRTNRSIAGAYDRKGYPKFDSQTVSLEEYAIASVYETCDPVAVGLINRLAAEFNQRFILTSRIGVLFKNDSDSLRRFMNLCGLDGDRSYCCIPKSEIVSMTSKLVEYSVVLDDEAIDTDLLVRVNSQFGFSLEDYSTAKRLLSGRFS